MCTHAEECVYTYIYFSFKKCCNISVLFLKVNHHLLNANKNVQSFMVSIEKQQIAYKDFHFFLRCRNSESLCSLVFLLCLCDFTYCVSGLGYSSPSRFLANIQFCFFFFFFGRWEGKCNFSGLWRDLN